MKILWTCKCGENNHTDLCEPVIDCRNTKLPVTKEGECIYDYCSKCDKEILISTDIIVKEEL